MSNIESSEKEIDKDSAELRNEKTYDENVMDKHEKRAKDSEDMEVNSPEHIFMCGVVEGFYGRPWTAEQRKELFRRMEEMGLNSYLYAPKDDYKHRLFWREKYSLDEAELLKTLINEAEDHGVSFVYAISPGLDMVFGSQKEVTALKEKLLQVKRLGCKAFALLFDDIDPVLCASDMDEFESSADAQASITNLIFEALDKPRFIFCPTEYCSSMASPDVNASPYLKAIGTKLDPLISVMWTGSKVVSCIITVDSIKQLNKILKRKIMIWDNIHANDYDPKRVFLGPYKGRSTHLIPHLSGVLTNPNCEFESNFVAMHTIATWWKSYKPSSGGKSPNYTSENKNTVANSSEKVDQQRSSSFELSQSDVESIGSGRASDTDTDSDSDYSSHEDGFYYSLPDSEHGDYDPSSALQKALEDWLPVFSWLKYPARKIVPRSGTPQVLPPIPNIPVNTRPVVPAITVTAMKDPVLSIGDTLGKTVKSESNSKHVDSDSIENTVIDDSSTVSNDTSEPSACAIKSLRGGECEEKVLDDVDMPNDSKTQSETNSSSDSSPIIIRESEEKLLNEIDDITVHAPTKPADIEMKEENGTAAAVDKVLEEMQTSPKNPSADQMETETDDVQEQLTPMITDDLDSDVSMATAQSGSVPATDEDMSAPSPAANVSETKAPENAKPLEIETETFMKVEGVKINKESPESPDMATPKTTKVKATLDSVLENYESNPMTLGDLRMLAECFFLPYEHGAVGKSMIQKFRWLHDNAIRLSRSKDKKSEDYLDKALDWSGKALAFEEHCRDIQIAFNKIIACPNRALLYDLFPYLWDLKGVIAMLRSYVKWLGRVEVKPEYSSANDEKPKSTAKLKKSHYGFLGPDPEPWAFRGGLSGEFQRLLPVSSAFDLFCQTLPIEPQVYTYVVRPYVTTDEKEVYGLCYSTGDDGMSYSDDFNNFKELPGDRLVGALLTLSPEYCFVAEDDSGLCGYLLAALDSKKFWTKYELAYLPEMRVKYEKPTAENDKDLSEIEKFIMEFHDSEDRFSYGSEGLHTSHPSLVTLALHPRANSNILKSMLVCLLSALKSHRKVESMQEKLHSVLKKKNTVLQSGSCGVHTVISADSFHFMDLYTKLGFLKITPKDDELSTKKNIKILGRTF